jgi:P-type Ca2+ transporter type 2C
MPKTEATGTPPWHARDLSRLWQDLDSRDDGLSSAEAAERLAKHGPNQLPHQPPPTWWEILLRQFQNPLIYVLVAAAGVAMLAGDFKDAGFIAVVLAINAVIGGYQEWRAEQSSRALQKLLHVRAAVMRDGEVREVDAEELVPGDVVWLESGNRVPADLRLISAQGLEVDESLLTGESFAVMKDADWRGKESTPVADRLNLGYAASIVIRGRAKGLVVATGTHTVVGQLAVDVMSAGGGKAPLIERMERFSHVIAYAVLVAVAAVSVYGIVVRGYSVQEMFLFGVALAVSAIPEGLPAALTVALAIATSRMARRGVIVRRLAAVEGLGSCTMIASDKTGTLTCNELTVRDVRLPDGLDLEVRGEGFAPEGEVLVDGNAVQAAGQPALEALVRVAVLCNEGDLHRRDGEWVWRGDPTDVALLSFGRKVGVQREPLLDRHPQVNEIPFEPEHQFAATFHTVDNGVRAFVKGAPERVLNMCDLAGRESQRGDFLQMAESMAAQGYRVLGLADGPAPGDLTRDKSPPEPGGLEFRGFVGMIDPLRPGVREAVEQCHDAGITVCMVTGDHPVTALAISRDLGLADDASQVISGSELSQKSPEELREAIRHCRVFARVAPRQKLELVEAARAGGHYVAVTGDGVNDAPALRAANIGVAMGKAGTDVAREAAELVISDDNFATIVSGVEEGRVAYDNVRKVIYLLVSAGAAEILLIATAFAAGSMLPLPFLPVQLLWLNLVTNGIQGIALAFEPGEEGILKRKPRSPAEPIFNRLMIERTLVAAIVMAIVGTLTFWWYAPDPALLDTDRAQYDALAASASNILLLLMVLFENVHIGNCRSETRSALFHSPLRSPFLMAGALGALGVHVLGMYVPFLQSILRTEPVSLETWGLMLLLALTVFVAIEIHKWTWKLRGYGP